MLPGYIIRIVWILFISFTNTGYSYVFTILWHDLKYTQCDLVHHTLTICYFLKIGENKVAEDNVRIRMIFWWFCWGCFSTHFVTIWTRIKYWQLTPNLYGQDWYIIDVECFKLMEDSVTFLRKTRIKTLINERNWVNLWNV